MDMTTKLEGKVLTVYPVGKIDTVTTPILEQTIAEHLDTVELVVIDMEKTTLISSACLRFLLTLHRTLMSKKGLILRNPNDNILEILDYTGFTDIFTIE